MKQIYKFLVLWLLLGMCYSQLELFVRGTTYVQMTFVGGLAAALVGLLDSRPSRLSRTIWRQCVAGTLIILTVEYFSGCLFNIMLRLCLWDYSAMPFNYKGQICLVTAVGWFFLCPLDIWLDDFLRHRLFGEPAPEPLMGHYRRLFTLK